MTVTEMTNTQMLYARAAANIARRNSGSVTPAGLGGSQTGSGGDASGQGGGAFDTALAKITALNQRAAAAKSQPATGDTVDLSAGAADAGTATGDVQPFAGLVEQFVRTRSAMSFTIPGQGGFGSMSFAYEVETAYRVIRPLQPGEVVDVQA